MTTTRNPGIRLATLLIFLALGVAPGYGVGQSASNEVEDAKVRIAQGDMEGALIQLKNAVQADQDDPGARYLLGQVQLRLGRPADAEKELRRALELGYEREAVGVLLGQSLLELGRFDDLLDGLAVIPPLVSDTSPQARVLRGAAYTGKKLFDAARPEFEAALAGDPANVAAQIGQARLVLVSGGNPDAALALVNRAIDLDPASAEAWALKGDILSAAAQHKEAIAAYTQALQSDPWRAPTRVGLGLAYIADARYDEAFAEAEKLRQRGLHVPAVFRLEGLAQYHRGNLEAARDALSQAVNGAPQDMEARAFLGATQYTLGDLQQAEEHLAQVWARLPEQAATGRLLAAIRLQRGDNKGAEEVLRSVIAQNPEDAIALYQLGEALVKQRRVSEGNPLLEQAIKLKPDVAKYRVALAEGLMALGDQARGSEQLLRAIEQDPKAQRARVMLIQQHLDAGQLDAAMEAAQALQQQFPESSEPHTLLGMISLAKNDKAAARQHLDKALKLSPGNPAASDALARLAAAEGKDAEARAAYRRALEAKPGSLDTLLNLARFEEGLGNTEAYRTHLEEAVKRHPAALEPRLRLAVLQIEAGRAEVALSTLREVQAAHATNPAFLAALAEAQLAAGQSANALATFESLVQVKPDSGRIHYRMALAAVSSGNQPRFRAALSRALELDPDNAEAPSLVQRLEASASTPEDIAVLEQPGAMALRGATALREGRFQAALRIFDAGRAKYPNDPRWAWRLSEAQRVSGDLDGCTKTLRDWLTVHPDDARTHYLLATTYRALDQVTEAKAALARVIEIAPDNALALNDLAWLTRDEAPARARAYAEKAAKLAALPQVLDTLGVILLEQGEPERALEILHQAVAKAPGQPTIAYHYAAALAKTGDAAQARAVLTKILADTAPFEDRERAEALLARLKQ